MRDEHVRRYARHILLPDVGGLGQTRLMGASARVELGASAADAEAALVAASYLAAGGVGSVVVDGATDAQLATVAAHGPDTRITAAGPGQPIELPTRPPWWPAVDGDDAALGFWRGALAAARWMAAVANP